MPVLETTLRNVRALRLANPPVNALSVGAGLVGELSDALRRAATDPAIAFVILAGDSGVFSAGADINDFEAEPGRLETLRALIDSVESLDTPVVAAIDGLCLGGGLELALAAHYRVAGSTARFGFPEIALGLLPGGGGTQRLPRLVAPDIAIDMMLGGKQVGAARALSICLVDMVAEGDAVVAAHAFIAQGRANMPRRLGEMAARPGVAEALGAARPKAAASLAASHIVDSLAAACALGFRDGLAEEARLFGNLLRSSESRALRHGFFGRSVVRRIPDGAAATPLKIGSVTVVGAGLMGSGIALALVNAGLRVVMVEPREAGRAKALETIRTSIRRDADKGRIDADQASLRVAALTAVGALDDAAGADLFIEAVCESMAVKEAVFTALDRLARPEAILASNTSTLDLNAIAAFTRRPDKVVGLHFFSPANIMRLLEIVRGAETSAETLSTAMAFARAIGKTGVTAGVCDGFIGNRIFEEYLRQVWFLLEEGALPEQIDRALESWGMAMGPCRVMDLAGQDIGWSIRKRRAVEQPDRPYSKVPDLVCEQGRFGQKTGAGFYRYSGGRTPTTDPAIQTLIEGESRRIGLERRAVDDTEIVERCIFAMINEGAKLVGEGIAYRPVDVDIVYLDGYGFPASRGGPLFYADTLGLPLVLRAIEHYGAGRHGWAWQPAPLLVELAHRGAGFASLNQ